MPRTCGPPALASKYQDDRHGLTTGLQKLNKGITTKCHGSITAGHTTHTHTKKNGAYKTMSTLHSLQYYCKTPTSMFVWSVLNTYRNHYAHPEAELHVAYERVHSPLQSQIVPSILL